MPIFNLTLFMPQTAAFVMEAIHCLDDDAAEGVQPASDIRKAMWYAFNDLTTQFGPDYLPFDDDGTEPSSLKERLDTYTKEQVLSMWYTYMIESIKPFNPELVQNMTDLAFEIFGKIPEVDLEQI